METRKLGTLAVSVAGLGCNNFGGRLDQERTSRVIDAALAAGINFFDTADVYGGTRSEQIEANVAAARWQLSADERAEVDRIAPRGPLS